VNLYVATNVVVLPSADFNCNEKMRDARLRGKQFKIPCIFTLIVYVYFDSGNRHEFNIF
jgi:hypothetical protein